MAHTKRPSRAFYQGARCASLIWGRRTKNGNILLPQPPPARPEPVSSPWFELLPNMPELAERLRRGNIPPPRVRPYQGQPKMIWADRLAIVWGLIAIPLIINMWAQGSLADANASTLVGMIALFVIAPWLLLRGLHFVFTGSVVPRRY